MAECVRIAAKEKIAFLPFSLQDCRPKGVSDKIDAGARRRAGRDAAQQPAHDRTDVRPAPRARR
jgi:hypothetical protein